MFNDSMYSSPTVEPAQLGWLGLARKSPLLALASIWILYTATVALYRVTLHPLAKFPGPKMAGLSYGYEFYFDVVLGGRYTRQIARLHETYGPIIRINPNELHCNDPEFVNVLYTHGRRRRHKSAHYLAAIPWSLRQSSFGTADHDHHQLRRSATIKHFSRSQVLKLEGLVREHAQHLCDKLLRQRGQGPCEAMTVYCCFSADCITDSCFGHSLGNLAKPGWNPDFKEAIHSTTGLFHVCRHIPILAYLVECIPLSVVRLTSSKFVSLIEDAKITVPRLVEQAKYASDMGLSKEARPTAVLTLLESDLPASEKTPQRIACEANSLVMGGTHTTAAVLTVLTYHLLTNPRRLETLRTELLAVEPDVTKLPSWSTLNKLPYLNAVILEGLRLMHGVASRLSLIAPDEELVYRPSNTSHPVEACYVIPRGYAMGISAYIMHTDERFFPNALDFVPERWLDAQGNREKVLERYLLAFSRGSRQCLGMQLAYCELFIAIAALALRVMPHMRLHETSIADVEYDHDQLIAMPKLGSTGVQMIVD